MQVKKDELRQTILEVAAEEFFKKGYENSSMRTIARKSNTTLGNIYHYFPNKEALLTEILTPTIENIEQSMKLHLDREISPCAPQDILYYLDIMAEELVTKEMDCFLDKNVCVLLNLKSTGLIERRDAIIKMVKDHLKWHLYLADEDDHYAAIAINMLIECLKHVLIEHPQPEQARTEFIKFIKMFCTGIIGKTE